MKQPTGLKAVGMAQHPTTKYWQVWISTTGQSIRSVAAFRESGKANDVVTLIQKEAQAGGLKQPDVVAALFGFLNQQSEVKPEPFSADLEAELLKSLNTPPPPSV